MALLLSKSTELELAQDFSSAQGPSSVEFGKRGSEFNFRSERQPEGRSANAQRLAFSC